MIGRTYSETQNIAAYGRAAPGRGNFDQNFDSQRNLLQEGRLCAIMLGG